MNVLNHAELDCGFPLGMKTVYDSSTLSSTIFIGTPDLSKTKVLDLHNIDQDGHLVAHQIRTWLTKTS